MTSKITPKAKQQRLKSIIDTQYGSRWTAASLAQAAGLTLVEMRTGFPEQFGKSALDYLREVRLRSAADQLVAGKSVSETAEACGFTTCGNLSRMFHKRTGIFPSHYRFKIAGWKNGNADTNPVGHTAR